MLAAREQGILCQMTASSDGLGTLEARRLRGQNELTGLAAQLMWRGNACESAQAFLTQCLPLLLRAWASSSLAWLPPTTANGMS